MFGPLEIALGVAALLIGATGTFSPCGLSVIDTIGPTGHTGGRRTTIAACVAFLPGAIAGGLLTFGSLAALGDLLHGAGGRASYLVAAAIALLAAVLEVRGTRIVPQIRRQLPEHWRRVMPMAVAAALYGVLLGIGFTTFVLSFGVWALAGVSLAVGDPALGLLLGACFGLGRALPILALAPLAGRPAGIRATELMCERPGVYLGLRRGDAAALTGGGPGADHRPGERRSRGDQRRARDRSLRHGGRPALPAARGPGGDQPRRPGDSTAGQPSGDRRPLRRHRPGTTRSFSSTAARWRRSARSRRPAPTRSRSRTAGSPTAPRRAGATRSTSATSPTRRRRAPPLQVASQGGAGQLSRPAVDGNTLLYALATPRGSRVVQRVMGTRKHRALVRSPRLLLFDPSVRDARSRT